MFLSQYAAKNKLDHPRSVYLRDDQVLELEAAQDRTEAPADKAEVYGQLGLTLTYDPARKRVRAEAKPESIMYVRTCPRGVTVCRVRAGG